MNHFDHLAKAAREHAVKALVGTKIGTGLDPQPEMATSFVIIKPNQHFDILVTPWRDDQEKRSMILNVCLHILQEGGVGYSFTSEVWMAKSKHEGPDVPPPFGKRPRDRVDRQEAVVALLGDGTTRQFRSWEIERDRAGVCTGLKDDPGSALGFESWIADSLDRAIALSAQLEQHPQFKEVFKKRLKKFLSEP